MTKGLDFKKNANFPKQMRFLFDGMDTDGTHYLAKDQVVDCISQWKAENYKWISKMIFLGADKDKRGKVPISELKDVSDNLGKSSDNEDFEYLCMLEFGKNHKELKYWEYYLILSGEVLTGIEADPYEGKIQSKCCFLI